MNARGQTVLPVIGKVVSAHCGVGMKPRDIGLGKRTFVFGQREDHRRVNPAPGVVWNAHEPETVINFIGGVAPGALGDDRRFGERDLIICHRVATSTLLW